MSLPTTAERSTVIDAPPATVYDLVSDVTRMGEWSPECVRCEWLDDTTFRGHNRRGLARWSTTARVLVADRPREFTFATLHRDALSTRWTYRFEGSGPTTVTESFESIKIPAFIAFVERIFIRNRQAQLEAGIDRTLAAIKTAAEAS
jgi:hypothetical protein